MKFKLSPDFIFSYFRIIYATIITSLLIEFFINFIGKESLLISLFSNKDGIGLKNYQLLPSRVIMGITGLELNSLNSLFFGPQSASMLALMCFLFYNCFDNLKFIGNKTMTTIAFSLLIYANTMTASLIFIIFLIYFLFFSVNSKLNNSVNKFIFILIVFLFFASIINTFFFVLMDDMYYDVYIYTWFQPLFDLMNLNSFNLIFGIPITEKIENYTVSWEFGLIQIIYLTGFLPIIFWISLTIYLVIIVAKLRLLGKKNHSEYFLKYYQIARLCLFVLIISMLSLFHYLAIFSNGFFQFIGIHLAILMYSIDRSNELFLPAQIEFKAINI